MNNLYKVIDVSAKSLGISFVASLISVVVAKKLLETESDTDEFNMNAYVYPLLIGVLVFLCTLVILKFSKSHSDILTDSFRSNINIA